MGILTASLSKEELAFAVVALFLLLFACAISYAMMQDYKAYLEDHYSPRRGLREFIKRERYYIYLFLGFTFMALVALTVYIMAMGA